MAPGNEERTDFHSKIKKIKNESSPTSTAIRVGVPPAAETRFSAGIIVQSEQVTCGEGADRRHSCRSLIFEW